MPPLPPATAHPSELPPDDDLDHLPNLDPAGDGSRVACEHAWNDAAFMIARGETMKAVADHLRCSRSTLWRTLQSSERLRTRIAEERRFLAVEAASRFKGLHGAALEAIEVAVRRGDLRAAFWVADRLGIAKRDIEDAGAGLAEAEDAAAWGEAPPVDPALFALDAPLALEPEVRDDLARASGPGPAPDTDTADADTGVTPARPQTLPPRKSPSVPVPLAASVPASRRETHPQKCSTMLHGMSGPQAYRSSAFHPGASRSSAGEPALEDLLRTLPATDAAWPDIRRDIRLVHAAVVGKGGRRAG